MKLHFTFIFSVLFASFGFCNPTSSSHLIKFSPVELLNNFTYDSGTLLLSYEKSIIGNYSINQDFGYVFHTNSKPNILFITLEDLNGFTLETEIRKYFSKPKKEYSGKYISLGFLYKYIDARDSDTFSDSTSSEYPWINHYSRKKYAIFRNEMGVHLKIGYQHVNRSGFTHDYSIGLGWRKIITENSINRSLGYTDYELPYRKPFRYGSKSFFSITFSIRFGWAL